MAVQVDGSSAEISAEMVGHAFVSQFYHILHNSPDLVQRFFQDESTMSRPGPNGMLVTVTAMKGINDLILSLDCREYKAEILTADAQASHMNGVIVLVTGCLTGKDNVRRKFTESFFLAPQEKGYYVLNDAFRFVEEDSLSVVNSAEEKNLDMSAPTAPSTIVEDKVEVSDESVQNQAVDVEVPIVNHKEEVAPKDEVELTKKETTVPQANIESICNAQPPVEASSNRHVDAPKVSYASLLKNMKAGATKPVVHAPASVPKVSKPNVAQQPLIPASRQQVQADVVPATASEASVPNGSNATPNAADQADDKGHSIYIGDLPWDATTEQVEQEFKKFGRIKQNGIQVRSNKGYCFGFVEYEDASGKQKAIEMGSLQIGGKEVFIQEKKTTTRVVNGVSMYPSGRGGFRNESFRGRTGYANGRGYARNDYGKRNGEFSFRSNRGGRDGFQGVYQNGGGGRGGFHSK